LPPRISLYGGNTAAWTAANIKVAANATLEVRPGSGALGTGFTDTDIATLVGNLNAANGGFANGSYFGIDTANGNYTLSQALTNTAQGTLGLVADGARRSPSPVPTPTPVRHRSSTTPR
jgi:hypothetical protein